MDAIHAVMSQIGKASLPDDINRADSKQLKGPHVLQVTAIEDVSTPLKGATTTSKQRWSVRHCVHQWSGFRLSSDEPDILPGCCC